MTEQTKTTGTHYAFIYVVPTEEFPEGRTFISPKMSERKEVNLWIGKTVRSLRNQSAGKLKVLKAIFPALNEKESNENYKTLYESVLG